jgi:hypothetical protein
VTDQGQPPRDDDASDADATDADALDAALRRERANNEHLRRVVGDQADALAALRRRPLVRALLSIERRTQSLRDRVTAGRRRRRSKGAARPRREPSGARDGTDHASLVCAITVAAPSAKVAHRWGDWHLANDLARAIGGRGHRVTVHTADHARAGAANGADVHLVVRGMTPVTRTDQGVHVLWVVSHPESLSDEECDDADLVLVASERFALDLRARTSTPVEVLLQATDHRRFRPLPPNAEHSHDVTVVAKTRTVMRPSVADALAAGLRPAIYGSGWPEFVDPELVVADHVPNEHLPVVYSSAGVLLNDHWDTMRASGFVSNRLFDALACGTPVISDALPEIETLFGDAVPTYDEPSTLRSRVDAALADPIGARARAWRGRRAVLDRHTFEHRAGELLDALARHGLGRGAGRSAA